MEYIEIFDEDNQSLGKIKEKNQAHQDGEVSNVKYIYFEELEKMIADRVEGLLIHEYEYKKLFEFIRKFFIK